MDPTEGLDKETASANFKAWWTALPPEDVTIFSDRSEKTAWGIKSVGYGYAVYQNGQQIAMGHGSINTLSHVFDVEVIGAWKGLRHMIGLPPDISQRHIWLCIDSICHLVPMRQRLGLLTVGLPQLPRSDANPRH